MTPPFKIFTKIVVRENIKDSSVCQAVGRQVFSDALGSGKCQESILLKIKMLIKLSSNCQEFLQIPTKYILYNCINNCNYICICRGRQLSSKCPRCHVSFTILTLRKNKSYKCINRPNASTNRTAVSNNFLRVNSCDSINLR